MKKTVVVLIVFQASCNEDLRCCIPVLRIWFVSASFCWSSTSRSSMCNIYTVFVL